MLNIVIKAVRIRLERGEVLDDILSSYPKLTLDEIDKLKSEVLNHGKSI